MHGKPLRIVPNVIRKWKNLTSTIFDQTITNLKNHLVRNEVVRVKIPKCMSWLDTYDEPVGDLDMMEDKLEDLGLNTCNHDIPLSSREVPIFDELEPQPQPLLNCLSLDVSLREERGPEPLIKPHSSDSFRMKVVDNLTIRILPSPHVASFHPRNVYCYYHPCLDDPKQHYGFKPGLLGRSESLGVDFSKLEMMEDDWELELKEVSFLGRGLSLPINPNDLGKGNFSSKTKILFSQNVETASRFTRDAVTTTPVTGLYLIRRRLEVLRKFHWMILGGRFNQLSHVSSPLLSKPGEYLKSLGFSEWLEIHALAKKLGVPPPPQLSTFRISDEDKKRKRTTEIIQEVFVKEDVVVDEMHRELAPPPPQLVRLQGSILRDILEGEEMFKLMEMEIESRNDVVKAKEIVKDNLDGMGQHL
ncbi:hypothetical protein Tco_1033287 [Tanacetum coccineum]|uniref:Uncharacterized protein n=1 Tax=Tanacetum coccineum TaxID=301880 RepID=A0ABQ5GET6_9ASTR